jgi:hypothetical protein
MVWVHWADSRPDNQGTRFGDDYPLAGFLPELGVAPQHMSILRRIPVPANATAGRYRLVAALEPWIRLALHRWWRGIPTSTTTRARPRRGRPPRALTDQTAGAPPPSAIIGRMDGRKFRHMGRLARIFWAYRTGASTVPQLPVRLWIE